MTLRNESATVPQAIVVVGASVDRRKFGNKAVRALIAAGRTPLPVHPTDRIVEDRTTFATLADVPQECRGIVSVYLPPPILLKQLPQWSTLGIGELWLNPGTDTPEVLAACADLGLAVRRVCTILAVGQRPADFPNA
ncbi:MAG: CoA-binding protein [Gemmataceae bacterium]